MHYDICEAEQGYPAGIKHFLGRLPSKVMAGGNGTRFLKLCVLYSSDCAVFLSSFLLNESVTAVQIFVVVGGKNTKFKLHLLFSH